MTQRVVHMMCMVLAALALQLAPVRAWAQPDEIAPAELAAARRLFVEGKELEAQGEWAAALEKFETVAKVKMTPQVRFHIALCHEHLGRWVDAVNGFEFAEQEARAAGPGARDVLRNAPERAEALRARVAHLTLSVTGTIRTSTIFLDGREVSSALVGSDIPLDPGDHLVEVKRDGEVSFSRQLSFAEAEAQQLELEIDDPEPPATPVPTATPDPQPTPPPPVADNPPQWIAYVVAGVGVAALGTAGAFWYLRNEKLSVLECQDPVEFTGCDPVQQGTADNARAFDIGAKVLVGVGVAGIATGVGLWFLLWPDDDPQPSTGATQARVDVIPSPTGINIVGTF